GGFGGRVNPVSRAVAYRAELYLVGRRIGQLDVPDRARCLAHGGRNAFAAPAAETDGPVHRRALPNLLLPLGAHLGQVVGERERRARAFGAMDDDDVRRG